MLSFIFPKQDIQTKEYWYYISNKIKKYFKTHEEICYICKKHSKNFITHTFCKKTYSIEQVITCFYYTDELKKYILNFKYYHRKDLQNELS